MSIIIFCFKGYLFHCINKKQFHKLNFIFHQIYFLIIVLNYVNMLSIITQISEKNYKNHDRAVMNRENMVKKEFSKLVNSGHVIKSCSRYYHVRTCIIINASSN